MRTHRRPVRRLAVLLIGALAFGAAPPALAAPGTGSSHAKANAPAAHHALSRDEASAKARATGKAVPVESGTTEDSTLTANPNGTFTLTENPMPVRKRVAGSWHSLDATLVKNANGTLSPKVSTDDLVLSGGGSGPVASMGHGFDSVSLTLPVRLPVPAVTGASATYAGVLPDVDLVVTATSQGGFSDVFVVKSAAAARDPKLASLLNANVSTHGVRLTTNRQGGLAATDTYGHAVFTASAPTLWDSTPAKPQAGVRTAASAAEVSSPYGPGRGARTGALKAALTAHGYSLSPDQSVLAGKATTYPVYIDPYWTPAHAGWATMAMQIPLKHNWDATPDPNGYMQVGNGGSILSHTFIDFPLNDGLMAGAHITAATVYVYDYLSWSCTKSSMDVYAPSTVLTSSNDTWNDWSDQNDSLTKLGPLVGSASFAHGWSSACPAASDSVSLGSNALSIFANDVAASKGTQTLVLTGHNELNDTNTWKELSVNSTTPSLSITFDHAPNIPNALTMSPGGACKGVTAGLGDVILYAGVSDPDGGTLGVAFSVYRTANKSSIIQATSYTPGASNYMSAGNNTSPALRIPQATLVAAAGGQPLGISWTVTTSDQSYPSPTSTECSFTFDPTTPGGPNILDSSGVNCDSSTLTYVAGNSYTFTAVKNANDTSSPGSFLYQINGTTPISVPYNSATGTGTGTITPTRQLNVLSITAVSPGGNVGERTVCKFNATVPDYDAPTATPGNTEPTNAAAPGDLTGDAAPDMLEVGGQNHLPSGLWLASGNNAGQLNTTAANIGVNGDGWKIPGSAADWNNTDVLSGQFSGTGFQDTMVLFINGTTVPGSSVNGFVLTSNSNDGSPLANLHDGSTSNGVDSGTACATSHDPTDCSGLADVNGAIPTGQGKVANAGVLSDPQAAANVTTDGAHMPDLLTVTSGTLWLDPSGGTGVWLGSAHETKLATINPYCSLTSSNCSTGWGSWSITTAMVGTGDSALPALFARDTSSTGPSAGQLWYYSPSTLVALAGGSTTAAPVQLATGGWDSGHVPLIQAANLNGTIALRALGVSTATSPAPTATSYLLNAAGTAFVSPANPTQSFTTSTHSWALSDATDGAVTTAADTPGASATALPLSVTRAKGTPCTATWVSGDLFDSNVLFDGQSGCLSTGSAALDLTGSFTVSAWVDPKTMNGVLLSQDGTANSGFLVYPTSNGWTFSLNTGSGTAASFDSIVGGSVDLNTWTHLTVTYDKPTKVMNLYVDDVLVATGNHTAPTTGATGAFQIGDDYVASAYTNFFSGQVAQVQTWTSAALPPVRPYTPASYHQSLTSTRILDTRTSNGANLTNRGTAGANTPVAAGSTLTLQITGDSVNPSTWRSPIAIPASATAVDVDITVVNQTQNGYLTTYPDGTQQPVTSAVNFTAGVANTGYQIVPIGQDGKIALYNGSPGSLDLVVDVTGYFTTDASLTGNQTYYPLDTAARALDTRSSIAGTTGLSATGIVPMNTTFTLQVTGANGVPSNASAVALNLTTTSESGNGYLAAYATGATPALSTSLTYAGSASAIASAAGDIPLSSTGSISIHNYGAATAVIVDIAGYYTTDSSGQFFHAVNSTRLVDTRTGLGGTTGPVAGNNTYLLTQAATSQITTTVRPTLALNLTAVSSSSAGVLVAYPAGGTKPPTSNLNFQPGPSIANLALVQTGQDPYTGQVNIFNSSSNSVHLVVDCSGYFSAQ